MNISAPFIQAARRHLAADSGIAAGGGIWPINFLPVAPLPQVDFPIISVSARRCPARARKSWHRRSRLRWSVSSAASQASTEMTSTSQLGSHQHRRCSSISIAISMRPRAMCRLPSTPPAASFRPILPSNPAYRKVNPADAPILILALTSDIIDPAADVRRRRLDPGAKAGADRGSRAGVRGRQRAAGRARRIESHPAEQQGVGLDDGAHGPGQRQCQPAQRRYPTAENAWTLAANDQIFTRRRIPAACRRL